ncbi:MAG TPA: alpha/beta hydrolase [Novosphingobium sp.]|nr:alpha/beta hydrolase [Novosphingobium sp.]HQD98596.1 alpha/beta hydrolase [Novosphingobium sp.]HQN54125.1 alpha/beta hydrolase [Novosphingobium sp.]
MTAWIAGIVLLAGLLAYAGMKVAIARNPAGTLDMADRILGGAGGARVESTGLAYGPLPRQRLEVIVPDAPAAAPRPVLVFIHGGGWDSGDAADYHFIGRTFARQGYVVVLPTYRLTPEGVFPRMLEDGAMALAWVQANIARHGGDPGRVVLAGHSAGAYNAVMLALERQWLGRAGVEDGFIKGVIGLSGPYDFFPFTSDAARKAFAHVAPPEQTQPIRFVRGDAPPMLLITGDEDTTVKPRNTAALAAALRKVGARVEELHLPGIDHSQPVMKLAAPFARDGRVREAMLAFLQRTTRPSALVQAQVR